MLAQALSIEPYSAISPTRSRTQTSILWPALLYIRGTAGRDDVTLNMGIVSQRVKDQIPSIEEDVGEHALVIGLFPMEADAFEDRITQEGANKISKLFGTPPIWWRVSQTLM